MTATDSHEPAAPPARECECRDGWEHAAKIGPILVESYLLKARHAAALEALAKQGATNWERVQAAGLILNGGCS